jgi:site-specific DNA-methyltransferase (adenine-specific)
VLDIFAGSGSTGRAARAIGRRAVLIEKRESQCEAAALRLTQGVLDLSGGAA